MLVEDFIINVYCCVEEIYREIVTTPLRSRGFAPKLTDSEVITMEIVGEFLGKDHDMQIYHYFYGNWLSWFPNLGSRANFVKQSANLWKVKQFIHQQLVEKMNALHDVVHLVDGFPMPVCKITRSHRSSCFKGEAAYGYCAAKDEKYYGFEGHVLINSEGVICSATFAAANIDERDVLQDLTDNLSGLLVGDKGYIRPVLKEDLAKQGLDLETPLRKNMKDTRPKTLVQHFMTLRRRVETVISQLTEHFHIEKVRARDCWHLTNRFIRKLLAYTVGVFLNKLLGNSPLHFAELIQS